MAEFSQVPDPQTPTPSTLHFNLVTGNSLDGACRKRRLQSQRPRRFLREKVTYRRNRMRNVRRYGLRFAADEQGRLGGDLDQTVFEHNMVTGVSVAVSVGRPRAYLINPVRTTFDNVVLYKNDFRRGEAAFAGSKAFNITGSSTTLHEKHNNWIGFETGVEN